MASDRPDEPLSIALIGCGGAGLNHGKEIVASPRWRLAAVCDVREEAAQAAADQLGGVPAYTDLERLLDAETLDAVAIITPGHVHVPQAVAAAARGLHVLSEKPLGVTVEECERAVEACRAAGVLLGVTYTYRFIADFRIMRQVLDSGEIGAVREVRWLYYGGPPPAANPTPPPSKPEHRLLAHITLLFDCGVHAFDLMRWFVGEPMIDVQAHATADGPGWEPTSTTLLFTYAGGQRGVHDHGSMTALPGSDGGQPAISFLVSGTRGSMTWDFKSGWGPRSPRTRICVHTAEGTRVDEVPVYTKCRDVQYAEFAQAVRDGALPPHWPTPEQAIEATRMAVEAVAAVNRNTVFLTDHPRADA